MPLAPRNAPCPCGSGRKYKKCCGFDRALERAFEDRLDAIEKIATLAYRSPQLLPVEPEYERWLEDVLAGERVVRPDEAIATLTAEERERIVGAAAGLFAAELSELSARCDRSEVVAALLGGSVTAGIRDRRDGRLVDLGLAEELAATEDDPFEALGFALDGIRLWDVAEGREAEREIDTIPEWLDDDAYDARWKAALRLTADRLATEWHRVRLAKLVREVHEQLPFAAYPHASAAIARGVELFNSEEEFRARLAAMLLSDLLGRERFDELRGLLAA